jgi:hypothetical protein
MKNLGRITNHHLVISESEQYHLVNALTFFHAMFDPAREVSIKDLISDWQDVADDTHLPQIDELATRIAQI